MAKLKPVTFNNLPEIDENDGMVILYDGSRLGKSTKEIGQIIDNQMQSGLEEDTQYAMTTSGWKEVVIPEVDLKPYAKSADVSAAIDDATSSVVEWAEGEFVTSAAVETAVVMATQEIADWAEDTFVTSAGLESDIQYAMTDNGWQPMVMPETSQSDWDEDNPQSPSYIRNKPDLADYAVSGDVDARLEEVSAWANETFITGVDLTDYAKSADVDTSINVAVEEATGSITDWADDKFVVSADLEQDTQYAMTTSGWERIYIPPTPVTADFRPGFAISFREGSGADTGKTFIDVTHTTRTLD